MRTDAPRGGGNGGRYVPLLTEPEVRAILKVSGTTIDRAIASGKLRVVRIGRTRRFHRDDVVRFVEQCRSGEEGA